MVILSVKKQIVSCIASLLAVFCMAQKQPADLVNPYMGNISHLLVPTFPTVHLPNSMLRVYPVREDLTTDQIKGLPVALTTHRGAFAFSISPLQGEPTRPVISYSYDNETIKPYRYQTYLDDENIAVDFAPSHQSGIYQLSFDKAGDNKIILHTANGNLTVEEDGISGAELMDKNGATIYLFLQTKQHPVSVKSLEPDSNASQNKRMANQHALVLNFGNTGIINIRYGISFISTAQAKKNLEREISTYDVNAVAETGRATWNKALGKIKVTGGTDNDKAVFYTSLYRTYERLVNISEDGKYYSPFDNKVHDDEGHNAYTDDWLWDTYRAVHPLRVLIEPQLETNIIRSFIRDAQQSANGWLPTFPVITGDGHAMNGNHGVAVILDAYNKGLRDFDVEAAYRAAKSTLTEKSLIPWTRLPLTSLDSFYQERGYYPALHEGGQETVQQVTWENRQPVPVTLGKSYDDWALSQLAKALHKTGDYKQFLKASYNYRNLFNAGTAFFHPKDAAGNFIEPFDYRFSGGLGVRAYYDENNGWVYRWDVQHNIGDLVALHGGAQKFSANLDATFREPLGKSKFEFYAQLPDQTGNMGQFSMANEPSLHIPYLYNYAGMPWKTQKRVRQLLQYFFRNDAEGVPGDEDGGGTSAFVVFSALGFYPVTPGSATYNIGSPLFSHASLQLANGRLFTIDAINCSDKNKYIQSATLNGKPWNKPWFSHAAIANGGKLVLIMGSKANKQWGAQPEDAPPSAENFE